MTSAKWVGKYAIAAVAALLLAFSVSAVHADEAESQGAYRLGAGDKVKITVYGEDDLSGEFELDGQGNVGLPMIGEMHASGMTATDFALTVQEKLKSGGFLINPRVSAEVTNYRPFTILGEVNKPGEYPYENGMSVLNAVALAGGWTYRADENTVYVRRKGSDKEEPLSADDKTLVEPGDTIRVAERIF
jgi:protein involved in polysaccharide export with SLBB domain